jgi:phosphatidylglycerol:prolipoprotein diacylglycerol transferase
VGWLFGCYLVAIGIERFLVEFVRAKDDRLLGNFTIAQVASVAAVIIGMGVVAMFAKKDGLVVKPEGALAPKAAA